MNISINVKIFTIKDFVPRDLSKSFLRELLVDVTRYEDFSSCPNCFSIEVLRLVRPISMMLRTMCSSSQYLAVLETLSYTVRESLLRNEDWFHSTDYEDFQVVVETKFTEYV